MLVHPKEGEAGGNPLRPQRVHSRNPFPHLFSPLLVGTLDLKNRIIVGAMDTCLDEEGQAMEDLIAFYTVRAAGGAALVITGATMPPFPGEQRPCYGTWGIYRDDALGGWAQLTRAVHKAGALIAMQLSHGGRHAHSRVTGAQPVAPSAIPTPVGARETPRELTSEEVDWFVAQFIEGARRAREVGFDAVEVHGSAGFLVSQFLSPLANQRTDRYGGSFENRLRFATDVVRGIKQVCGADFPVLFRLSADEFMDGGNRLEETKQVAQHLAAAGVELLDMTAGWHESPQPQLTMDVPRGGFALMHAAIKQAVDIPVSACHRINDPLVAESIVASGQADAVTLSRALLADPNFPRLARRGRVDEIRRCIACCDCIDAAIANERVICAISYEAGREASYRLRRTRKPKRVLVVGSGPAGMEAAALAAKAGHEVEVWERSLELGGTLIAAAVAPHKEEIADYRRYLVQRLARAMVSVRLSTEATREAVAALGPDAVIIATGADPVIPPIPGVENPNVVVANTALLKPHAVRGTVVIVGGGWVGCEVAEFLASCGHPVTIVEMLPRLGADISPSNRWVMLGRLRQMGVTMLPGHRAEAIVGDAVEVFATEPEELRTLPADTVVISVGFRADRRLADALDGTVPELHVIGDAVQPRRIRQAVWEAAEAVQSISARAGGAS